MKAGRELDALIAEKVFGRKTNGDFFCDEGFNDGEIPLYSTMIEDAWRVVDKFDGYSVLKAYDGEFEASVYRLKPSDCGMKVVAERGWETAETAPLAICLSALKACGVEVDG